MWHEDYVIFKRNKTHFKTCAHNIFFSSIRTKIKTSRKKEKEREREKKVSELKTIENACTHKRRSIHKSPKLVQKQRYCLLYRRFGGMLFGVLLSVFLIKSIQKEMTAKMVHYVLIIIDFCFLLFAFVTRKNWFRIGTVISPFDTIDAFLTCTRTQWHRTRCNESHGTNSANLTCVSFYIIANFGRNCLFSLVFSCLVVRWVKGIRSSLIHFHTFYVFFFSSHSKRCCSVPLYRHRLRFVLRGWFSWIISSCIRLRDSLFYDPTWG